MGFLSLMVVGKKKKKKESIKRKTFVDEKLKKV